MATSVHLVCRPRPDDAPVGDWGQVLRELSKRVADWMERLQGEGVRGADLVFACIGPALEVYSRYAKVVDAEEREIPLGGDPEAREVHGRGSLAYVREVVGRAALEQVLGTAESRARNGAAGALEEDARLTALFLWTLQATTQDAEPASTDDDDTEDAEADDEDEDEAPTNKKKKGVSLPFDVARRFAQPPGIHLDAWEGRCIETEKGIVRLVPVLDRAEQRFGEDGAEAVADRPEKHRSGPAQMSLFPTGDDPPPAPIKGRKRKGGANVSDELLHRHRGTTTLDHVHAAILLQTSGRANALRALLKAETERGPDFLRLANALSAPYPQGSDALLVVDDFCPTGSAADVQRYHMESDRLFRGQGNRSGRQRLRSDSSLRPSKPLRGQSLRARQLVLEISPGDLGPLPPAPNPMLTARQKDATEGKYAAALAGFLCWLPPQYEAVNSRLKGEMAEFRHQARADGPHAAAAAERDRIPGLDGLIPQQADRPADLATASSWSGDRSGVPDEAGGQQPARGAEVDPVTLGPPGGCRDGGRSAAWCPAWPRCPGVVRTRP